MNLRKKILQASFRKIDQMDGEELLVWLDRTVPIFSCEKKADSAVSIAREYAMARLDRLTR